jgi:hypothetical protein
MDHELETTLKWVRFGYEAAGYSTLKWEDIERKIIESHAGHGSEAVGAGKASPAAQGDGLHV